MQKLSRLKRSSLQAIRNTNFQHTACLFRKNNQSCSYTTPTIVDDQDQKTQKRTFRYKISFSYNGCMFSGFQVQNTPIVKTEKNKHMFTAEILSRQNSTVQGTLQECFNALNDLFVEAQTSNIKIFGSSRTDAQVHALCNTCHVDVTHSESITPNMIQKALNSQLRTMNQVNHLRVNQVKLVPSFFISRYCAYERTYVYRVIEHNAREFDAQIMDHPLLHNQVHFIRKDQKMDLDRMKQGASMLVGQHNFSNFCKISSLVRTRKNPVRLIHQFDVLEEPIPQFIVNSFGEEKKKQVREIQFHVKGQSFLHNQIRYMVAALIKVGEGKLSLEDLKRLRDDTSFQTHLTVVPGHALYLCDVKDCETDIDLRSLINDDECETME